MEEGDASDLLLEVHQTFLQSGVCPRAPAYRTLCEALQQNLDYTRKRLSKLARERDAHVCDGWKVRMLSSFSPKQLVLVDESAADSAMAHRTLGYSKAGRPARSNKFFFHRGKRYSALGPFVLDDGFLDSFVIEGGFDNESFLIALHQCVIPYLNPYPQERSVLVMDNCRIHRQHEVAQAVAQVGAMLVFLEPYDPVNMPVEVAYRGVKQWLRHNYNLVCRLPADAQIRLAFKIVGKRLARNAFKEAGYF